jgi:hypothetical protein
MLKQPAQGTTRGPAWLVWAFEMFLAGRQRERRWLRLWVAAAPQQFQSSISTRSAPRVLKTSWRDIPYSIEVE